MLWNACTSDDSRSLCQPLIKAHRHQAVPVGEPLHHGKSELNPTHHCCCNLLLQPTPCLQLTPIRHSHHPRLEAGVTPSTPQAAQEAVDFIRNKLAIHVVNPVAE
jgi:hypothetical protein